MLASESWLLLDLWTIGVDLLATVSLLIDVIFLTILLLAGMTLFVLMRTILFMLSRLMLRSLNRLRWVGLSSVPVPVAASAV